MNLDRQYPYVTTRENRCDWCECSIKFVPYKDQVFGKKYCSTKCEAEGVARDIRLLEESQTETDFIEDLEDDVCLCARHRPPED